MVFAKLQKMFRWLGSLRTYRRANCFVYAFAFGRNNCENQQYHDVLFVERNIEATHHCADRQTLLLPRKQST